MKRLFYFALLTVTAVCGCRKGEDACVIPANASMVVSLDMMKFSMESDLMDSRLFEQACRLLKINPLDMGIDFTEPLYIFRTGNDYVCLTATVGDEDDMTDCLTRYARDRIAVMPKRNGELTWSRLFGEIEVAYNDETLLLAYKSGQTGITAKQMIRSLFEIKPEDSFHATEHYRRMREITSNDITVYSNLPALSDDARDIVGNFLPENADRDAVRIISALDGKDGALVISSRIYSDRKDVQKVLDEQWQSFRRIEGTCLDKVPERSLITVMAGVDGTRLYQVAKSIPQLSRQLSLASLATGCDLDGLISSTDGDIMICSDDNGNMMWNINGVENTDLPNATTGWYGATKSLGITKDEIGKYCLYGYADLTKTDIRQYTRLISIPSVYNCINCLEGITFYSEGQSDITIRIESSNNENIFKQLLK